MRMIQDQFTAIYDYDPAMRRLISESQLKGMSLEEKYHIISAYMKGGGIKGLIGPEDGDDDDDMGDLSEEERHMVEEEFRKLYGEDERFRIALEGTKLSNLTLRDKYELIMAYSKRPGEGSVYSSEDGSKADPDFIDKNDVKVEGEFVTYKGKIYKRVQLDQEDDDDDEYLMDERGNIYDTRFRLIGRADDDDERNAGEVDDDDDEDLFKNHLKK